MVAEWSSDEDDEEEQDDDEDGDGGKGRSRGDDDDPIHVEVVDEADMATLKKKQADKFKSARSSVLLGFSMDQVCVCFVCLCVFLHSLSLGFSMDHVCFICNLSITDAL